MYIYTHTYVSCILYPLLNTSIVEYLGSFHILAIVNDAIVNIFCSVTKSSLTLCNPMDCSMPGFLVFHYFPEFAQTHVH